MNRMMEEGWRTEESTMDRPPELPRSLKLYCIVLWIVPIPIAVTLIGGSLWIVGLLHQPSNFGLLVGLLIGVGLALAAAYAIGLLENQLLRAYRSWYKSSASHAFDFAARQVMIFLGMCLLLAIGLRLH